MRADTDLDAPFAPDWVLVPRVPTDAMLRAAQSAWLNDPQRRTTTMWSAMLAAAPSPAAAPQQPAAVDGLAARLVDELDGLVSESDGVSGLHLNGDVATWEELLPGGRFERLSSLDELRAALAAQQQGGRAAQADGCHCATCTCKPGMTPAVRFDTSPVEREGAVRDHLIRMGWTPPKQPEAQAGSVEVLGTTCIDGGKCHHGCTERCFRRERCAPFSGYVGSWEYPEAQVGGAVAAECVATVCHIGVGPAYAHGNFYELQVQVTPGTKISIGDKLYTTPPPSAVPPYEIDALFDALSNLEHDNYERSYSGSKNREADAGLIRAALERYVAYVAAQHQEARND